MEEVEGCAVAEAAGIICSLRAADLAGWTPPWKASGPPSSEATGKEEAAWPAVARGKRTRSSRSGSKANKGRWARGSPASPLDYSGASTSGGEDGAFCSPPEAVARVHAEATPTAVPASSSPAKGVGPGLIFFQSNQATYAGAWMGARGGSRQVSSAGHGGGGDGARYGVSRPLASRHVYRQRGFRMPAAPTTPFVW